MLKSTNVHYYKETDTFFESLVRLLPNPISVDLIEDETHRSLYSNKKFIDVIGCTCREIKDYKSAHLLSFIRRNEKNKNESVPPLETRLWINCKDGIRRLFQISFRLMNENVLVSIFNEITLKEQYRELEELIKLRDRLLSIVAHDVRNVLNGIQGLIEMFLQGDISKKEFDELLLELNLQNDKVRDFLENLISWTKKQWGQETFNPQKTDLIEIVEKVKELFTQDCNKKQIQLEMKLPTDNIAIFADKQMVEIILRNLLSNAVKFTPSGGKIEIKIGQIAGFAQIKVKDTGVGVSKEKIQLIIKGGLLSNVGTNGEIGTGLGLNLCIEYAKKNGGRIDIHSEEGKGTEITCYLPLA